MTVKTEETAKKPTQKYSVPALDKALDVLELLSAEAASLSQVEISRTLGRNASGMFRTLNALESRGYIRRTQAGQYRLTLKLFELGRAHSPYDELLRVAAPALRTLSEEITETCHLSALRDGEIVVLAQHESPKALRLSVEVGSRHPILSTTSGRIILASMQEQECLAYLNDYTGFEQLPKEMQDTFRKRVSTVRQRGYEITDGERFVGGLDIGTLVGSPTSKVKAALIVATLRGAHGPDPDLIRDAVIKTGRKITELVGLS